MKDIMSDFEFYALYTGKRESCYLAQTLCLLRESNLVVIENSLMHLRGQTENVSNKKTPPSHP